MNYIYKTKSAFTLTEALITLGIIGIVAAITIPTLIHKHKLHVLHNQFKQAYSILLQMHQQMLNDDILPYNDFVTNEHITNEIADKHIETIAKYLNAEICNNNYRTCTGGKSYKTLNNANNAHINADSYINKTILLNNGMTLWRGGLVWARNRYYIDINGTAKGPNKLGYDLFTFHFDNQNKLTPEKDNQNTSKSCSFTSTNKSSRYIGFGCTYYASIDQNPDDETKTYWKDFLK